MSQDPPAGSASSDLFDNDPAFLKALEELELPDLEPPTRADSDYNRRPLKRVHSPDNDNAYMNTDTYGAASFGGIGEYMFRKRAKLQVQNAVLDESPSTVLVPQIFRGLAIYIDGYTKPSVQELRTLIVKHGGVFHAYLDRKSMVTHILASSLTPAKIQQFQNMKVATPDWLTESATAGLLLPWDRFIFRVENRAIESEIRKAAQQPLFGGSEAQGFKKSVDTKKPDPVFAGYSAHRSNPHAERAMANPEWRAAHTSAAPDFIEGFYKNSRLHHLSTWKAELKKLVQEAQDRAEQGICNNSTSTSDGRGLSMRGAEFFTRSPSRKGKEKASDPKQEKIIMHCDFDAFFVSAGLVDRPHLRGKPVVVCHSQGGQGGESSTSEIASASYEARKFGIKNGMSLNQARKMCTQVQTIPYEFQKYRDFSLKFYTILMSHADDLQAVSVDEALIDVTSSVDKSGSAKELAEKIRDEVRIETSCEVSIGISHNIMLARLATRKAKPAGSFHLVPAGVRNFMDPLDIKDLHGFGYSLQQKAQEKLGTTNLGQLLRKSKGVLCDALGKGTGEILFNALRGVDEKKLESDKPRKSVSADINYGIRFQNNGEVEKFVYHLAEEVSRRLVGAGVQGRSITLKVMKRDPSAPLEAPKFLGHGICETFNKQTTLVGPGGQATDEAKTIAEHAWRLIKTFDFDPKELRGIGIQIQKLENQTHEPGQAVLPFKSAPRKEVPSVPQVVVHPPSSQEPPAEPAANSDKGKARASPNPFDIDIPTFSQMDMSVYHGLPEDLRREVDDEIKRRSLSPGIAYENEDSGSADVSTVARHSPMSKIGSGSAVPLNVKRITKQLAPRSKPSIPFDKPKFFGKRSGPSYASIDVSKEELQSLGLDPQVFALLPLDIRREQLSGARIAKKTGFLPVAGLEKRVVIKPVKRKARSPYATKPFPKANYITQKSVKQQGKTKGEKLIFTETEDIQEVIEKWVEGFRSNPPNQRDVDYFGKFLVGCVDNSSGDVGVEKAIKVAKWWQHLLRKYWSEWEVVDMDATDLAIERNANGKWGSEMIGRTWWRAFRGVKQQMDVAARKRFGGCLSLR